MISGHLILNGVGTSLSEEWPVGSGSVASSFPDLGSSLVLRPAPLAHAFFLAPRREGLTLALMPYVWGSPTRCLCIQDPKCQKQLFLGWGVGGREGAGQIKPRRGVLQVGEGREPGSGLS